MMDRLSFQVDPELDQLFPEKRLAKVEFTLRDGRVLTSRVYAADGEASDHVDMNWIVKKFRRITAPFLNEDGQQEALTLLQTAQEQTLTQVVQQVNHFLTCFPAG